MKELEKNEVMGVDGGFTQKLIGLDGNCGCKEIFFLNYETGELSNILGQIVFDYW
ncbi:MAG: hypothetical protein K0M50_03010 [Prolixibacteraceae bacterium]|nr:hypothetical protein [Prolixibacteraceae bacterium]